MAAPRLGATGAALGWAAMVLTQNAVASRALCRRVGTAWLAGAAALALRFAAPTAVAAMLVLALPIPPWARVLALAGAATAIAWPTTRVRRGL